MPPVPPSTQTHSDRPLEGVTPAQPLVILVPPSKTMAPGGGLLSELESPTRVLGPYRERLAARLDHTLKATPHLGARIFESKGALLERYLALRGLPPSYLPAHARYQGVLWRALDPATLPKTLLPQLFIPSPYYGISCATDEIVDYRLSLSSPLNPTPLGYWPEILAQHLSPLVGAATVVNLLPNSHRPLVAPLTSKAPHLIDVTLDADQPRGSLGHEAKHVKGLLARWILERGPTSISEFHYENWNVFSLGKDSFVLYNHAKK